MTERDLSTLVRDHVTSDEPPFALSPDTAIGQGRRKVRTRRAVGAVTCAAVLAIAGALAVPRILDDEKGGAPGGTAIDPAIQRALDEYDASEMPRIIEDHATAVLDAAGLDLGKGDFFASGPNSDESLPPDRLDEADGMTMSYGGGTGHEFHVELLHAGSEAEGNARKDCTQGVSGGLYLSCEVTVSDRGDVVLTRFWALTPGHRGLKHSNGWSVVYRDQLDDIDPQELWFERSIKVIKSDTFLTRASETIKAADQATAEARLQVPAAALRDLATDPDLVMPPPE